MTKVSEHDMVQSIIDKYDKSPNKLLSIFLDIQEISGSNHVSEANAQLVAKALDIPICKIYDVIAFYEMLYVKPQGKYIIEICKSAVCHVGGAPMLVKTLEALLGISMGETTGDGLFSLRYSSCFGACNLDPVIKIGDEVYGNLDAKKLKEIVQEYRGEAACQK